MQNISFDLKKVPVSLNKIIRMSFVDRGQQQETWDWLVYEAWLKNKRAIYLNPVHLKYVIYFKTIRSRDYDNYYGGTKFITDALKRTFLLRDDSSYVKKIEVEFAMGNEKTAVFIQEIT